jgi:uncharacterized protein YjaZ
VGPEDVETLQDLMSVPGRMPRGICRRGTINRGDPAVMVGEQIVSEGLADAFARQLYGDLGYTRDRAPVAAR